jgi:hypothetical protein
MIAESRSWRCANVTFRPTAPAAFAIPAAFSAVSAAPGAIRAFRAFVGVLALRLGMGGFVALMQVPEDMCMSGCAQHLPPRPQAIPRCSPTDRSRARRRARSVARPDPRRPDESHLIGEHDGNSRALPFGKPPWTTGRGVLLEDPRHRRSSPFKAVNGSSAKPPSRAPCSRSGGSRAGEPEAGTLPKRFHTAFRDALRNRALPVVGRAENPVSTRLSAGRRGRDSNPRWSDKPHTRLAGECLQPLGHLSRCCRKASLDIVHHLATRAGNACAGDRLKPQGLRSDWREFGASRPDGAEGGEMRLVVPRISS